LTFKISSFKLLQLEICISNEKASQATVAKAALRGSAFAAWLEVASSSMEHVQSTEKKERKIMQKNLFSSARMSAAILASAFFLSISSAASAADGAPGGWIVVYIGQIVAFHSGQCLTAAVSPYGGYRVEQWPCDVPMSEDQIWKLFIAPNAPPHNPPYRMKSVQYGLCADVSDATGPGVHLHACDQSTTQSWYMDSAGSAGPYDYFVITSISTSKVLDIYGGSVNAGAKLIQWAYHGGANQMFGLHTTRRDFQGEVVAESTGLCVAVGSGGNIVVEVCAVDGSQDWLFLHYFNDLYTIESPWDGKCVTKREHLNIMDASPCDRSPPTRLRQLWKVRENSGGVYRISSHADSTYFHDSSGGTPGPSLILWDNLPGAATQRFRVR